MNGKAEWADKEFEKKNYKEPEEAEIKQRNVAIYDLIKHF